MSHKIPHFETLIRPIRTHMVANHMNTYFSWNRRRSVSDLSKMDSSKQNGHVK